MNCFFWQFFIILSVLCPLSVVLSSNVAISPKTREVQFNKIIDGNITNAVQYIYIFNYVEYVNSTQAFRIHVQSGNANTDFPLMIVVRQQRSILSWKVPLNLDYSYNYKEVSRTLCPVENTQKKLDVNQTIFVEVSTDSRQYVHYSLNATILQDFEVSLDTIMNFSLSPSEPKYFKFTFPKGVDAVRMIADSPDENCMIMSVQSTHCPVFDLVRNVEFKGTHATVAKQGIIPIQRTSDTREDWDSVYVVFVLKPDDFPCSNRPLSVKPSRRKGPVNSNRIKKITFTIQKSLDFNEYYFPVFGAIAFFLCFYLAAGLIALIYHFCDRRRRFQSMDNEIPSTAVPPIVKTDAPVAGAQAESPNYNSYGSTERNRRQQELDHCAGNSSIQRREFSDIEDDFDKLEDSATDKDIRRTKKLLFVSDLSRKTHKHLTKKYRLYHWYLIIIAIFYGLPVIQLVLTYQLVFRQTGKEDLCYYNFYCANPLGILAAFNNIISNIGYVMLGLLFLGLTARRDYMHRKAVELSETFQQDRYTMLVNHGIPQYFGLFYAMGIALVMEGVLSACYHVCPNSSNFQFDTAFMYVLACLLMLKIYQTRHPDVNASAHAAYMVVAVIILIGVMGVFYGSMAFWVIFALILILGSMFLTIEIYYMGRWAFMQRMVEKIDTGMPRRLFNLVRNDGLRCIQPTYRDRMILLVVINGINMGLALYGAITQPIDFSSYLLSILMANLFMYFAFYIIMKIRSKEKFLIMPLLYVLIACASWATAIYFFVNYSSSWELTAANSRELNTKCILLNFYDVHDVWHFLSALSLFFSFMVLLTLDDDLIYTPRNRIPVF